MSAIQRRRYRVGGVVRDVDVARAPHGLSASIDGKPLAQSFDAKVLSRPEGGAELSLEMGGGRRRAVVVREGEFIHVHFEGRSWRLQRVAAKAAGSAAGAASEDDFAPSPMTGLVRKVLVKPGDAAAAGATLFVVEAMKMEFAVPAPRDVVVAEVRAKEGDRVDIQQVIVTFRPQAAR